jgi:hypothetical protein
MCSKIFLRVVLCVIEAYTSKITFLSNVWVREFKTKEIRPRGMVYVGLSIMWVSKGYTH